MPAVSRRGLPAVMGITFLAALLVRILYLIAFHPSPFYSQLMVDAQWHDQWASSWADGGWGMDGRAFFRAPLYPLWLSLIYKIVGHDLTAVRVIQAVLGSGTAAALAGAGFRMGGARAGWAAGLLTALYGPLVFFDGELLIPNLLVALLAWALFLLSGSPSWGSTAGAALLLGAAGVARPNVLILLFPAALFVAKRARGLEIPGAWRRSGTVLALGLVPALGVTGVNAAVEGVWVFVASQGGVNFYAGNNPQASGTSMAVPELQNIVSWRQFVGEARSVAERAEGHTLDSGEVSDWWFRRGLKWLAAHPKDAAGLYARKAYLLANAYEIPNNRDLYFERPAPLRVLLWKTGWFAFPWGVVFPLAVMGWMALRHDVRLGAERQFLALWFVLYGATFLPFFVTARFRMGLLPAVIILAGLAVARWRRVVRGWPLAAGLAAFVLANSAFLGARAENPSHQLGMLGDALLREGRTEEGVAALERGREGDPRNLAMANMLAEGYARMERYEEALELYAIVVAGRPNDPVPRFNLGVAYLALSRFDDAVGSFDAAVRLAPEDPAAWLNLGVAQEGRGMIDRAESAYRESVRLAPREELGYLRLGAILPADEAMEVLRRGVSTNPESFELHLTLARALAREGRFEEARAEATAASRLRPDDPRARELEEALESAPRRP